jgi:hypothetical protein
MGVFEVLQQDSCKCIGRLLLGRAPARAFALTSGTTLGSPRGSITKPEGSSDVIAVQVRVRCRNELNVPPARIHTTSVELSYDPVGGVVDCYA